jgi:hypothetical protein
MNQDTKKLKELRDSVTRLIQQSQYEDCPPSAYLRSVLNKINDLFGKDLAELEEKKKGE